MSTETERQITGDRAVGYVPSEEAWECRAGRMAVMVYRENATAVPLKGIYMNFFL